MTLKNRSLGPYTKRFWFRVQAKLRTQCEDWSKPYWKQCLTVKSQIYKFMESKWFITPWLGDVQGLYLLCFPLHYSALSTPATLSLNVYRTPCSFLPLCNDTAVSSSQNPPFFSPTNSFSSLALSLNVSLVCRLSRPPFSKPPSHLSETFLLKLVLLHSYF